MSVESRGYRALCGVTQRQGLSTASPRHPGVSGTETSTLGWIAYGLGAVGVLAAGSVGYLIYKANQDPDTPEEDTAGFNRVAEATKKSGTFGAVTETLAVAKTKKTMKTPFGFRVPNLARYMLPEAEQTRAVGAAIADAKGISR